MLFISAPTRADVGVAARISSDVVQGQAPLDVQFDLLAQTQPSGEIAQVEVDAGDGSGVIVAHTGRGWIRPRPRHTYTRPGRFTARIRVTTTDGQQIVSRTRVTVAPEHPADPEELLQATPTRGDAPHTVQFRIGGNTLPFTARAARISFGDGEWQPVLPLTAISHTYTEPGLYAVHAEFRGNNANRARSTLLIRVEEEPRLRFTVAPTSALAPAEITIRANIPRGDIQRAAVLFDGEEIAGTEQIVGTAEVWEKLTLTEPDTYLFELQAITNNGQRLRRQVTVELREEDLAEGTTYYEHNGGVVQIVQQGGAFEGIMRAPTTDQALAGYDIGTVFVRGAFADRSTSHLRPDDYDDPDSPQRRYYAQHATQTAGGTYLIKSAHCPDQWGDYGFNINFGGDTEATTISGTVVFKGYVTRAERAYQRSGLPMPRPGIAGRVQWVADMIDMMRRTGDHSGRPDECVEADEPDSSRGAVFTRISEERAQEIARQNMNAIQSFAEHAYDGIVNYPVEGEPPRVVDPTYGDPPSSTDPVMLASGEFYETATDLRAPAPLGVGWSFRRSYRSQSPAHTSLGRGWVHNYQLALVQRGDGWLWRTETGGYERFRPMSGQAGLYQSTSGARLSVSAEMREIRLTDGTIYQFSPVYQAEARSQLDRIIAPGGAALVLDYDLLGRLISVTDPAGRVARYTYDTDRGYLTRVTAPAGNAIGLQHDGDGNLVRVSRLSPEDQSELSALRYGYASWSEDMPDALRGNLTAVRLPAGVDGQEGIINLTYGSNPADVAFDRVVYQQTGQLVEEFTYRQDDDEFVTTLRAEGRATEEHRFAANGQHLATTYVLDSGERVETRLFYDDQGRPARRQLASGAQVLISDGPTPDTQTISRIPAEGAEGNARPLHWVVARDAVFDRERAVWGPFVDAAPASPDALVGVNSVLRVFDYQEAGHVPDRFGLEGAAEALGDVNGDGRTDQAAGRIVLQIEERDGTRQETRFIWNDNGTIAERHAPDGTIRIFDYDGTGALVRVSETDAVGRETELARYDWDADGNLIGLRENGGPYVGFSRNAQGRIARALGPDGFDRRYSYDHAGRITEEQDANGQMRHAYSYDAFGNLTQRVTALDATRRATEVYSYDAFGRVIAIEDPAGQWSRTLDALGRTVMETNPQGVRRFAYDTYGQLISEAGAGWEHQHTYDGHGQLIETRARNGTRLRYTYSPEGTPLTRQVVDAAGGLLQELGFEDTSVTISAEGMERVLPDVPPEFSVPDPDVLTLTAAQFNWQGQIDRFTTADGAIWQAERDLAGRLTRVLRGGVVLMEATFNQQGAPASVGLFGFAPMQAAFDDGGETITDGRGAEIKRNFDVYGRLISETATLDGTSQRRDLTRDVLGRVTAHMQGDVNWQRRSDAPMMESETQSIGDDSYVLKRGFDQTGRLTHRVLPGGTEMRFDYPEEDRAQITVNGQTITLHYGPSGALIRAEQGAAALTYVYPQGGAQDTAFRVQATSKGAPVMDHALWFTNDRVTSLNRDGQVGIIERDTAGRIVSVDLPVRDGFQEFTYHYDATGVRVSEDGATPALPAHAGAPHSAALDPDGRVTELDGINYWHDARGLLSMVNDGQTETRYLRDALGRVVRVLRDGQVDTDILYDGGSVAAIYPTDGPTREFILDANGLPVAQILAGEVQLLALDYGGGPLAAVNGAGAVTDWVDLTPFGAPLTDQPELRVLLDGMLYDPVTGLYLTPSRAMLASRGQFLAPDPFGPMASPDPYIYAGGDPFTFRDATGAQAGAGSGGNSGTDDTGYVTWFFDQVAGWFDDSAEKLEEETENFGGGNGGGSGGSGSDSQDEPSTNNEGNQAGQGGTPDAGQNGPDGSDDGGGFFGDLFGGDDEEPTSPPPSITRDFENERQAARDRAATRAAREAERRAEEAAFKRNTRHARRLLPENVQEEWLQEHDVFDNAFEVVYDDERVPWGDPATGPVSGNPGDPHRLLRAVLEGEDQLSGRRGDRLRFIFREQLSAPPPAPPAAQQQRQNPTGRPPAPGGMSGNLGGGTPLTTPLTTQPTPAPQPQERREPGGLSGSLGF